MFALHSLLLIAIGFLVASNLIRLKDAPKSVATWLAFLGSVLLMAANLLEQFN